MYLKKLGIEILKIFIKGIKNKNMKKYFYLILFININNYKY